MVDFVKIGQITSAHGIKGEVKVYPLTDNIKRYSKLKFVFLKTKEEYVKVEVRGVKYFKEFVILGLANIESMNDALKYKNEYIYIDKENVVKLPRDSYFISDLIDMEVTTSEGEYLGKIINVFSTGSNDVYEIKSVFGKSILIPAIKDVILEVDVENKRMLIKLLEGLV
jgi:16S rRNA processing protein RimM